MVYIGFREQRKRGSDSEKVRLPYKSHKRKRKTAAEKKKPISIRLPADGASKKQSTF